MPARIVGIILPVFLVMLVGFFYAYWRQRQLGQAQRSSQFGLELQGVTLLNMNVLGPMLVFSAMVSKDFVLSEQYFAFVLGAVIALGAGLVAWPIARLLNYSPQTLVPPMIYKNCGNLGIPLSFLAFGTQGLSMAVAMFFACNFVYFSLGVKLLQTGPRLTRDQAPAQWRMWVSPMMCAMYLGLLFALLQISLPEALFTGLKMMGEAGIVLMLFVLGARMTETRWSAWRIGLTGALLSPLSGFLVVALIELALAFWGRPFSALERGQAYLFASLPPAVLSFMFAEYYQQESEKVAAMVLMGNMLALVMIPFGLWWGIQ